MGIESAIYTLFPAAAPKDVELVLREIAIPVPQASPHVFSKWVKKGDLYWIDIMNGNFGPGRRLAISVRVAVCNPPEAEVALRGLLETFLGELGGSFRDDQTGGNYTVVDDAVWADVRGGLISKRDEFRRLFGSHEAAISGDAVFSVLRQLRGDET